MFYYFTLCPSNDVSFDQENKQDVDVGWGWGFWGSGKTIAKWFIVFAAALWSVDKSADFGCVFDDVAAG